MPATEPASTNQPTDPAAIDVLAEKIGQIVRQAIRLEFDRLRYPSSTGLDLPPDAPAKAAVAKQDIESKALEHQGLIDLNRLAKLLSLSRATVFQLMSCEAIPEPIRFGRCIRWREIEILAWLEERCPVGHKWQVIGKQAVRDYERSRRIR